MVEFFYYKLDLWFSSTVAPKPRLLAMLTTLILMVGSVIFFLVEDDSVDFGEASWSVWTFVADAGLHAKTKGMLTLTLTLIQPRFRLSRGDKRYAGESDFPHHQSRWHVHLRSHGRSCHG